METVCTQFFGVNISEKHNYLKSIWKSQNETMTYAAMR